MSPCPACATPTEDGFRFCPACGVDLRLPDSPTGTAPGPSPSPSPRAGSRAERERFVPGTILAGRYRIVGLLGRGGMGEVYRADDLKLEQPVALKFLTRAIEGDRERIERLYAEVRTARQVSHPAVCRVWDIGEAEGQHFLSMEFVDGENLASLLRRIGRFPQDKAVAVARQIAEGLSAAHAKGLLHRDLKPANVMIDGQGHVRLTDFGLAGLADELSGDVRSGTPSYMSPEQLAGREVSVRSDVYALGLVIYELVTGRRAFEGKGFAELARQHRDERPIEPAALVPDLDPALERTILACLEKEPRRRPASALVVAAMLSGRDPLAAAIAAGETPSPELVAAAGEREGLAPRVAAACLAAVAAGVLAIPLLQGHLIARVPVDKSPAALEDRARDLVRRVAPDATAVDSAIGLGFDSDYMDWLRGVPAAARRDGIASGEPPLISFWYRQGPRPILATNPTGRVLPNDPPVDTVGMAGARYDLRGRLLSFYWVPPELERDAQAAASGPAPEPDWSPLLAEAGLDPAGLRRVAPRWTPPFYADTRVAWEGHWPSRGELELRVEAAGYRGRAVWLEVKSPFAQPRREQAQRGTPRERRLEALYVLVMVALVATGCGLAYRNISLGRGDRRGAFRLALALALLGFASWALVANHTLEPSSFFAGFVRGVGLPLMVASLVWIFYLALEPYVRRLRPWTLVSWTRLLGGGLRDPVVGRDVLVGLAFGTALAVCSVLLRSVAASLGDADRAPELRLLDTLVGARRLLGYLLSSPVNATLGGLALLLLFLVLRLLTRRDWIASLLVVAFLVLGDLAESSVSSRSFWILLPLSLLAWSSFVLLMLRFGVLAAITAVWTANLLIGPALLYAPDSWIGDAVYLVIPLLLITGILAFQAARAGSAGRRGSPAGEARSSPSGQA